MKVSLIGYGSMGREVEAVAREKGTQIVSIVDPVAQGATHRRIDADSVSAADVAICFTAPAVALDNIAALCAQKMSIVMATTGWAERLEDARKMTLDAGVGFLYASNFSLGVNLFFRLASLSARLLDRFEEYDVAGYEMHHARKKDSPSGTAVTLVNLLLENLSRKTEGSFERLQRPPRPEELHFSAIRGGHVPGTHAVVYDSVFDQIEIKHTARTRQGFAYGALLAARWLRNRQGFFTEGDLMRALLEDDL